MQSLPNGEMHLYHSVKSSNIAVNCSPPVADNCIVHHKSVDNGQTWSNATVVTARKGMMESIAGKYFPTVENGEGGMVIVTDGGPGNMLTPFVSKEMGSGFQATIPPTITEHPPLYQSFVRNALPAPGTWANVQIGFIPDINGAVTRVAYSLWQNNTVFSQRHNMTTRGYTHTIYNITMP
eukprot:m.94066 g.94066  ORF g.94066 m.94066 type:complete len:180 (-) comp13425_c0_seq1:54-593(-)